MVPALLAFVLAAPDAEAAPVPRELTPAVLFDRMLKEYERIERDYKAASRAPKRDKSVVRDCQAARDDWRRKAFALVRLHPADPAALDVLKHVTPITVDDRRELVRILREHHFADPRIGRFVTTLARPNDRVARGFAVEIAEQHPDRAVRGKAFLDLAQADISYLLNPTTGPVYRPRPVPADVLRAARTVEALNQFVDELRARAAVCLNRVVKDYADIPASGTTLGKLAAAELVGLANFGLLEVGSPAPAIVGEDLDGKPLALAPAGGKVTALVFWVSRDADCTALVPIGRKLAERYKDRPFALVGANSGDERPAAKAEMAATNMAWSSFYCGRLLRSGAATEWNVMSWPTVYVIDPAGIIRYKGDGKDLEKAVEECMAKLDPAAK